MFDPGFHWFKSQLYIAPGKLLNLPELQASSLENAENNGTYLMNSYQHLMS